MRCMTLTSVSWMFLQHDTQPSCVLQLYCCTVITDINPALPRPSKMRVAQVWIFFLRHPINGPCPSLRSPSDYSHRSLPFRRSRVLGCQRGNRTCAMK
ncbi:hypothetical protein P692DRAFT_20315636 [Suillus brevipes Sb2]|nr:hypothetical protein P692DRAFT_20315636 [Suillus brevipes Sb2]